MLVTIAPASDKHVSMSAAASTAVDAMSRDQLSKWKTSSPGVDLVTMTDTTTPFLNLNGKEAYAVEFKDVEATIRRFDGADSVDITMSRDFNVYTDSETGSVLKIVSKLPSLDEKLESGEIRIPTSVEAEEQLKYREANHEFVATTPTVGFLEVLEVLPSNPLKADMIVAVCVKMTRCDKNITAWIVDTYGVESITMHGNLEAYQRNHIRTIVDANTGELVSWTNKPFVEE